MPTFNGQLRLATPSPTSGASSSKKAIGTPTSHNSPRPEVNPSRVSSSESQRPPDILQPSVNASSPGLNFEGFDPSFSSSQNDLDFQIDSLFSDRPQGSAFNDYAASLEPNLLYLPTEPSTTSHYPPNLPVEETSILMKFLRQDNERLSSSRELLREEIAALSRRYGAMQAQLSKARDQLQPLDDALQRLLYLPDVQHSGSDRLMNGLFAAMKQVSNMKRALMECEEG